MSKMSDYILFLFHLHSWTSFGRKFAVENDNVALSFGCIAHSLVLI